MRKIIAHEEWPLVVPKAWNSGISTEPTGIASHHATNDCTFLVNKFDDDCDLSLRRSGSDATQIIACSLRVCALGLA